MATFQPVTLMWTTCDYPFILPIRRAIVVRLAVLPNTEFIYIFIFQWVMRLFQFPPPPNKKTPSHKGMGFFNVQGNKDSKLC